MNPNQIQFELCEIETEMMSHTRDGLTWESWTSWYVDILPFVWEWSRESHWYDGPIDFWHFGPFFISRMGVNNYDRRRPSNQIV
jgi:hypothetical protein